MPITIDGPFTFSDHQLALYERCPRRFLYTHILEIGGRRTESAFMKLHVVVQHVVDDISRHSDGPVPIGEIERWFSAAWDMHGPVDHGYNDEYMRIAWQLVRYYVDSASGMKALPVSQLRLPVSGGEITVTPDQILSDSTGRIYVRPVQNRTQRSERPGQSRRGSISHCRNLPLPWLHRAARSFERRAGHAGRHVNACS